MTNPSFPSSFKPKMQHPEQQPQQQSNFPSSFVPKQQKEGKPSFESDENLDREIERNQAVLTSRMLERLFGTPGNIYQSLPEAWKKINPLDALHSKLPTEEKLRGLSEKYSGGYTKPKNSLEEKSGEVAGDIASFSIGSGGKTLLGHAARTIGIPLAGAFAKEGIAKVGGGKNAQEYGKLGTMLLLDLWGLKHGVMEGGAKKFGQNRLNDAKKAIPEGARAHVPGLEKELNALESSLKEGFTGPHTSDALRAIDELRGKITNGTMDASLFPKLRESVNLLIENMKGFSLGGPPARIKQLAVENLNKVKKTIIEEGSKWGKQHAPEFAKNWAEGNEALAVAAKSKELANYISKHAKIKNPILKHIFGLHAYHNPVGAAALTGVKKTLEVGTHFPIALAYRFFKSKVLRDLYQQVLKEAIKSNASGVASGMEKLEKEIKKEKIE